MIPAEALTKQTCDRCGHTEPDAEPNQPRVYWDDATDSFVVPEGACPYPIDGNWTAKECIAADNCGCDEFEKHIQSLGRREG